MEKIKTIRKKKETLKVYNIEVKQNSNYFANDILVHNCYVSAKGSGEFWANPAEVWKRWMSMFPEDIVIDPNNLPEDDEYIQELFGPLQKDDSANVVALKFAAQFVKKKGYPVVYTQKPFQIAIGSTMEPTIHPEIIEFMKTVNSFGTVSNYTTNGITLADENSQLCQDLLQATRDYCGGVAVSYGNAHLRDKADRAIQNLIDHGECKVMIHHLISDKASVEDLVQAHKNWNKKVHYHVLLPLMEHGRSEKGMEDGMFEFMAQRIKEEGIDNIALGANFLPYLKKNPDLIKVWEYPQETYSKNVLLKDSQIVITPSSYNLKPVLTL